MLFKIILNEDLPILRKSYKIIYRKYRLRKFIFTSIFNLILAFVGIYTIIKSNPEKFSSEIMMYIFSGGSIVIAFVLEYLLLSSPERSFKKTLVKLNSLPPSIKELRFYKKMIEFYEKDIDVFNSETLKKNEAIIIGRLSEEIFFAEKEDYYILCVNRQMLFPIPKNQLDENQTKALEDYFSA